MTELSNIAARSKNTNMTIDKLCKIKTYLPTREKFVFLKEYDNLIKLHVTDYSGYEEFVGLIFFNLLIVKTYTDIELKLTYEEFDRLQECGLIGQIANCIGADYDLMMSLVKMKDMQK